MIDIQNIAILGGSFNPPHIGHKLIINYVNKHYSFIDQIFVVPVGSHAFGKDLISFETRKHLCELCFTDINTKILDIEKNKVSKTYNTIIELKKIYPTINLYLIIGTDLVEQIKTWYKSDELLKLVKLIIIPRNSFDKNSELPEVSSSKIRELIKSKRIKELEGYLSPEVLKEIIANEYY
jgi:nicotinate-nucleotide adenylyltransferase